MRRVVELHWPALLVGCACLGLALSIWVALPLAAICVVVLCAAVGVTVLREGARLLVLGVALAALGLGWGSLRIDALQASVLVDDMGESGVAELVTVAPARSSQYSTRVLAVVRTFRHVELREKVLLLLPVGRSPPRGAILEASVRVIEPRPEQNGFDERAWLARQGIHVVLKASSWEQTGRRGGLLGLGDRLSDRIDRVVSAGTEDVRRGVVLGVVLGEDEGLPADVQKDFRASGLYHLLAVSGQNVAFLAAGVSALGWLLRLGRTVREVSILLVIAAYVLAVGWQPSVVRAAVAGGLAALAWLAARPRDRWHFLAVGALVLLAWMPTTLLDPGFQLSFAAVGAIFVAVPRVRHRLAGYPIPAPVAEALAVAFACSAVTAPIVLVQFDRAPMYTVPANVVAFVAAPLVLGFGLLAAVVSPISPEAAAGLAALAGWCAAWLALVAHAFATLPGAQIGARSAALLLAGAATAWLVVRPALNRLTPSRHALVLVVLGGCALAAGVVWFAPRQAHAWREPGGLRVTFLDVGQGDSVLLETRRARVLVDEGPPEADVAGQLAGLGIRSLSALVMTHPQRDHVGGAADVIRRIRVAEVLQPGLEVTGPESDEALAAARARNVPVRVVRTGSRFRMGRLVVNVLWPEDAGAAGEDPNQNAVVLIASYGETDVFLSADAESDVTSRLRLRPVEVMKVAHHGSVDPGLASELGVLRPRVAVISCGRGNEYGHPRPETLAALEAASGLAVYRTDEDGRVVVESDGRRLTVRTER